jgi:hypothetical protein
LNAIQVQWRLEIGFEVPIAVDESAVLRVVGKIGGLPKPERLPGRLIIDHPVGDLGCTSRAMP